MAYVDLNPVRAGMAQTLEKSDFTSVQERLATRARQRKHRRKQTAPATLAPFAEQDAGGCTTIQLPATLEAYVELLEWTGRLVAKGKRGKIVGPAPALLTQHGLRPERWVAALAEHQVGSVAFLGTTASIESVARKRGKEWLRGLGLARRCSA